MKPLNELDYVQPSFTSFYFGDVGLWPLEAVRKFLFEERGVTVRRYSKPTMTRVAPEPVKAAIAQECDAVLEALAD